MMKMQALAVRVLHADVFRYPVDILHQFDRMLKGVGIHLLHQIGFDFRHAGAVIADIIDLVGVVHVAHLDLLIGEEGAGNAKRFAHLQQLPGNIGIHGRIMHQNGRLLSWAIIACMIS